MLKKKYMVPEEFKVGVFFTTDYHEEVIMVLERLNWSTAKVMVLHSSFEKDVGRIRRWYTQEQDSYKMEFVNE